MTTPTLPEDRWIGIWAPESMRRAADGYGVVVARSGDTAALGDYDNIDASILPFLAYQENAFGYFINGTESQRREALRQARDLNRLVGTEGAMALLMDLNFTTGRIRYLDQTMEGTPYRRHKFVDVDIIQPPGEPINPALAEYLSQVVAQALPYTLQLRRVNITGVIEIVERHYIISRGYARGYIVDGDQWP